MTTNTLTGKPTHRLPITPIACSSFRNLSALARLLFPFRFTRQSEIDLFLERVNLANFHDNFVTQLDDTPRAPADQMVPRGFENKEVIVHRRKMDQPAHAKVSHIDEKSKISH